MPIYVYECPNCGEWEMIAASSFDPDEWDVFCPECHTVSKRKIAAPARTPGRWGDTNAHVDPVLGYVKNSMDFERKMKERGLVPMSDVRTQAERNIRRQKEEYERGKRIDAAIKAEEARTGGPVSGDTLLKIHNEVK